MENDNLLIICRTCGRKVLMHNMRPDGENMICLDCYKKGSAVKSAVSPFAKKEEPVKTEKAEKMNRYICTACKYKFSRKVSQPVAKCPYCGKNTIILDSGLGADKLIKASLDNKYDW